MVLKEIEDTDYKQDEHKKWQDRVKERELFEVRFREVNEAEKAHFREQEILDSTIVRLAQLAIDKQESSERLADLKKQMEGREDFRAEFDLAQQVVTEYIVERDNVTRDLTRIDFELERLSRMIMEQREKMDQRKSLANQKDTYAEVAKAFGKQGVQALLIETALPAIEEEANILLSTMTEGKMSLQLESQRETRQGRIQETLGVSIADEMGTRPYEMYSGGEAFRINLALRIGLSRILTRRSGAPLPVLFIDEGFGSQDLLGRDRIVDAISSIQNEFQLIIVITHIDELKELFPNRIEVKKSEEGSEFTVIL
jgi:exonuclease SbcC